MYSKNSGKKFTLNFTYSIIYMGSSFGIVTDYELDGQWIESRWGEIFRTCPVRPWGQPSLLYNGYRDFPGGIVRPGRDADHSRPSSAVVIEEYSYTSTTPLGHNRACKGNTFLCIIYMGVS